MKPKSCNLCLYYKKLPRDPHNHGCTCLPDTHRHNNTRMKLMQSTFVSALFETAHDRYLRQLEKGCSLELKKSNLKPRQRK